MIPSDELSNVTFDELFVGRSASLTRELTRDDIALFAFISGDVNPAHMDPDFAGKSAFHGVIGHGMWTGAVISAVLGTVLPGPGTIYLEQDIRFRHPVRIGDSITARLTVKSKRADKPIVVFDCLCTDGDGDVVAEGTATVLAPTERIVTRRPEMPDVEIHTTDRFRGVIEAAKAFGPIAVGIVHPVTASAIEAAVEAARENLITPTFIGPKARMLKAAADAGVDISAWTLIDVEHSHAAADKAVELASSGELTVLMKGSLHTDELLEAVLRKDSGLRTERRISHAYVIDAPTYHKPLILTDAAINIAPTLVEKVDICQNAIDLWRALFDHDAKPKVALLSAVENVTERMPSTLDAASLCKMADRGQITDAILDGPLAFDNVISKQAAVDKGISSPVAGDADIIVAPNIETGNALGKQLTFLSHAEAAGVVLGARVPIILTSRSDSVRMRILSCVVALHLSRARDTGAIK
jgi:phosphate acetyltransferase